MLWWLDQLTAPLSYLRIRIGHEDGFNYKAVFDFILPLVAASLVTGIIVLFVPELSLVGQDGLFRHMLGLTQVLVPFFIAALAAVASMNGSWLDENLRGSRPTTLGGIAVRRRELVIRMFGYLAYSTLMLYLAIGSLFVFGPVAYSAIFVPIKEITKFFVAFILLLVFSNIMITTMLSLYFLSDRLHEEQDQSS